jgi:hypothetical protein
MENLEATKVAYMQSRFHWLLASFRQVLSIMAGEAVWQVFRTLRWKKFDSHFWNSLEVEATCHQPATWSEALQDRNRVVSVFERAFGQSG